MPNESDMIVEMRATIEKMGERIANLGGCPDCGALDGILATPDAKVFVCHRHRTAWVFDWDRYDGDLPEYQLLANLALIKLYRIVDPVWELPQ